MALGMSQQKGPRRPLFPRGSASLPLKRRDFRDSLPSQGLMVSGGLPLGPGWDGALPHQPVPEEFGELCGVFHIGIAPWRHPQVPGIDQRYLHHPFQRAVDGLPVDRGALYGHMGGGYLPIVGGTVDGSSRSETAPKPSATGAAPVVEAGGPPQDVKKLLRCPALGIAQNGWSA